MTNMAAMHIYGKNLKKSSSPEVLGRWPWNLVCSIVYGSTTKVIQIMTLGWPWLIWRQGQIWSHRLLYGKKWKLFIFWELLQPWVSETTGLNAMKFHIQPPGPLGKKSGTNDLGHMTNMATMPIYGKNLKKSSPPEPIDQWPWNLVCSIMYGSTTKIVQIMTLGWPWPILHQGQIWSHRFLYGKSEN